jgi:hypothetical protein
LASDIGLRTIADWRDRRCDSTFAASAIDVTRPDFDARDGSTGDQKALGKLPKSKQTALDADVASGFDGTTYGGRTWELSW